MLGGLPFVDLGHPQVVRRVVLLVDVGDAVAVLVELLGLVQRTVLGVAYLQQCRGEYGGYERADQYGGLDLVGEYQVVLEGEFADEEETVKPIPAREATAKTSGQTRSSLSEALVNRAASQVPRKCPRPSRRRAPARHRVSRVA